MSVIIRSVILAGLLINVSYSITIVCMQMMPTDILLCPLWTPTVTVRSILLNSVQMNPMIIIVIIWIIYRLRLIMPIRSVIGVCFMMLFVALIIITIDLVAFLLDPLRVDIIHVVIKQLILGNMGIFSSVPIKIPRRSIHNLSFSTKFSGRFGYLYPTMCRKIVPGDRFTFQSQGFSQFATMATKVYQDFVLKQEMFFVPSRLLWDDFEKFYSLDESSNSYIHPYFNYAVAVRDGYARHGSLFDYFNLPTFWYPDDYVFTSLDTLGTDYDWSGHVDDLERIRNICNRFDNPVYRIDALPFIAFLKIYAEYYADENLQSSLADWDTYYDFIQGLIIDHNSDLTSFILDVAKNWRNKLYNRNYPKDYFTGSLPFAQKGPQVNVPFTGQGTAEFYVNNPQDINRDVINLSSIGIMGHASPPNPKDDGTAYLSVRNNPNQTPSSYQQIYNRVKFENGITSIDDLRTAIMLQEYYEKQARCGTRYKETILAHFGVLVHDSRLQRALFLLGVSTNMQMGNVYSTSQNVDGSGITGEPVTVVNGAALSRRRKFSSSDPGYIIGFASVFPRASYYKGIPREWMELDKFDYFWPDFQHLGEQEVKIAELSLGNFFFNDNPLDDEATFGYNPRYSQYKVAFDQIHGDFRDSRKSMSSARDFSSHVALNKEFIRVNAEYNNSNRVFNYTEDDTDKFDIDLFFKISASRPMSYYGVPRIL